MNYPEVSIVCITYNHENYISKALDGFISQKTNFKFEIIVYDDASTDNTAKIIKEYEKKYPKIIKPIFQKENQYSKGIKVTKEFAVPKAKGKYLAFCEGDDYWTDNNKLQLEYDIMERDKSLSMCAHGFECIKANGDFLYEEVLLEKRYSILDFFNSVLPGVHTSTRFIRKELYQKMPDFFYKATVGDLTLLLWCLLNGDVYYISKKMSVYRLFSLNSWSRRLLQDQEFALKNLHSIVAFYNEFNEYTNFYYDTLIKNKIDKECFGKYYICGMYKEAKETNTYKRQNFKTKLLINIGIIFPKLVYKFRQIRNLNH